MKFDDLVDRVVAEVDPTSVGSGLLREVVRLTLAAVDLHVSADGEVYSPAPAPPLAIENVPKMNAARYGGRTRRRR